MAPDERDRSFDKALARRLRSTAPGGQSAEMPREFASQGGACPDPETLAAYHERSLLPEQLNSLKEHLVACANCQTVLAHLETTDRIPLQAAEEDQVFAQTASAPVLSASSQSHAPVEKTLPVKSRRARLLKGARWPWLAPAGAIAAGLLVWIALHENQPLPRPASSENENKVAQNREPAAPLPSVSSGLPQSSAPPKSATALPPPKLRVRQYAGSEGRSVSEASKQSGVGMGPAAGLGKSLHDKELNARKDDKRTTSADQLAATNHVDLDAKNLPQTMRQTVEVQSQAPAIQEESTQPQNLQTQIQSNNSVSQNLPGPSPSAKAEPSKKAKRETAPPPAPQLFHLRIFGSHRDDFQSALDLPAGLTPYLARGPRRPHRILQRRRLLLVPPDQRRPYRLTDRCRSLRSSVLDCWRHRNHSPDHRWRRPLEGRCFAPRRRSWRSSRFQCASRHHLEFWQHERL